MDYATQELLEDLLDAMANYRALQLSSGHKAGATVTAGHILRIKEALNDPFQALKDAYAAGATIQCVNAYGEWFDVGEPSWDSDVARYRVRP